MGDAAGKMMVDSGVLVPVYRGGDGALRVVLIRRSDWGGHAGHLAFPGGKRDPADASMLQTALREAREEIGIPADRIEILAELPPIETRTSGFRIYPVLGRVIQPVRWQRNAREVAEIMDLSLLELVDAEVTDDDAASSAAVPAAVRTPYYRVGAHQLWGVSYRILRALAPRLLAGEWEI